MMGMHSSKSPQTVRSSGWNLCNATVVFSALREMSERQYCDIDSNKESYRCQTTTQFSNQNGFRSLGFQSIFTLNLSEFEGRTVLWGDSFALVLRFALRKHFAFRRGVKLGGCHVIICNVLGGSQTAFGSSGMKSGTGV